MLSVKHFVCCGMDVHKKFIVATIAVTDYRGVTSYIKKRFATFNSDLKALKKWLLDHNCTEVCMESTGKYWIPVLISWKIPAMSLSPIPNMSGPSKARKQMIKILPGLPTFLNLTSFLPATFPVRKSAL